MPALVAGIHVFLAFSVQAKMWMAGTGLDRPGHDAVVGPYPSGLPRFFISSRKSLATVCEKACAHWFR